MQQFARGARHSLCRSYGFGWRISGGSHGGEFTSAFGRAAEVQGRTASAAFGANARERKLECLTNMSGLRQRAVLGLRQKATHDRLENLWRQVDRKLAEREPEPADIGQYAASCRKHETQIAL